MDFPSNFISLTKVKHRSTYMVYRNTLTTTQKDKKIPKIIHRDGDVCYFDEMPFVQSIPGLRRTIDHLNNNAYDNRIENLGLCHFECNQKKKNNAEMQLKAKDKLAANVMNAESLGEGERDNYTHRQTDGYADELTEGDVNLVINKLVKSQLETMLPENSKDEISYTKTLRGITYLVINETEGRGSEAAVRRSLDAHCSEYADWADIKQGRGNRVIRRRKN